MPPGTGSERARRTYAYLREQIASGAWPVNGKIPTEPELSEILGVGRTTVREAVRSLANVGMLETLVGRGTFVRSRTPVSSLLADFVAEFELSDILGYRRALEIEAAQQAALHRTDEQLAALRTAFEADLTAEPGSAVERGHAPGQFHFLVVEAADNRLMASLYAGVMAGLRGALRRGEVVHGTDTAQRHADHEAILTAIEAGDVAAAAHAMASHVDRDLQVWDHDGEDTPRAVALSDEVKTVA